MLSIVELIEDLTYDPAPSEIASEISYKASSVKKVKDSVLKNLSQLRTVAKAPFTLNDKVFMPPVSLQISEGFWQRYGCYLECGACCAAYSMDYLPEEWLTFLSEYKKHVDAHIVRCFTINGRERIIRTFDQKDCQTVHGKDWCRFLNLENGGCTIHEYNALSCQVELIKFASVGNRSYIRKQGGYSRGWAMVKVTDGKHGVLCDAGPFSKEQFYDNDLKVFWRMKDWADYFEIPTWLPEIIELTTLAVERGEFNTIHVH